MRFRTRHLKRGTVQKRRWKDVRHGAPHGRVFVMLRGADARNGRKPLLLTYTCVESLMWSLRLPSPFLSLQDGPTEEKPLFLGNEIFRKCAPDTHGIKWRMKNMHWRDRWSGIARGRRRQSLQREMFLLAVIRWLIVFGGDSTPAFIIKSNLFLLRGFSCCGRNEKKCLINLHFITFCA